ncbi:RNA polymerase sigma factor [Prolixibacter denitrificans]|uniref:RNA polymerase sigma factor n=1 Tax=Prolixibacter denitrificans TaxID=1541063 RepID=A0A2P8CI93_9BACT|nr:sigma-70 family RNA polymerase sigma factor [Prolixibacter denitrificans]PSK84649.1 RNA polymerase sigma-70 factor (ECF subfamily) [Prolixibacter denitrificans]GET20815.1 RNA polymerase sigma factor [Prolixibacter denitrificans]
MDEKQLVIELQAGDEKAFRQLVGKYQQQVFRTAMGFVHDGSEADDIAQEVFVEVFRSVHGFRGEASLSTWIYRMTVNRSLNRLRSRKRKGFFQRIEAFFQDDADWTGEPEADCSIHPEAVVGNQETAQALQQALESLPENQRTAFVLYHYEDMAYKEIATVMNVSLPSVESLIHRARKNLQKKLMNFYKK